MSVDFVEQANHASTIDFGPVSDFVPQYNQLRMHLPAHVRADVDGAWNAVVDGVQQMGERLQLMIDHNHGGTYLDVSAWEKGDIRILDRRRQAIGMRGGLSGSRERSWNRSL
jgi:hypothetical protein